MVRKNDETDELVAYRRHCKERHPDLPEPHNMIFSSEDLSDNEKDCLSKLQNTLKEINEIVKEQKEHPNKAI